MTRIFEGWYPINISANIGILEKWISQLKKKDEESYEMELTDIRRVSEANGVDAVYLQTTSGVVKTRLHDVENPRSAVIWVSGAGGGLTGPAGGMYVRLAERLAGQGVGSLRVDYRRPNHLADCALDTLMGATYMRLLGYERVVLVGHSFGGAVVITAAAQAENIIGLATLASQNSGTELASALGDRALLLMHGDADTVLPPRCSQDIYNRARRNKQMILYPGCGHNFDDCGPKVEKDLLNWMGKVL